MAASEMSVPRSRRSYFARSPKVSLRIIAIEYSSCPVAQAALHIRSGILPRESRAEDLESIKSGKTLLASIS